MLSNRGTVIIKVTEPYDTKLMCYQFFKQLQEYKGRQVVIEVVAYRFFGLYKIVGRKTKRANTYTDKCSPYLYDILDSIRKELLDNGHIILNQFYCDIYSECINKKDRNKYPKEIKDILVHMINNRPRNNKETHERTKAELGMKIKKTNPKPKFYAVRKWGPIENVIYDDYSHCLKLKKKYKNESPVYECFDTRKKCLAFFKKLNSDKAVESYIKRREYMKNKGK